VTATFGTMTARLAIPADAPAITAIYNQGIADRVATFETQPRTEETVNGWFGTRHPIVVVEHEDRVVAFAATSGYRSRECYAGVAEFSVYVEREIRGRGAGQIAMEALIREASAAGFWKLLSRVFVENAASRRLLRALGFREVGVYQRHAQLDGIWRDVVIVERLLDDAWDGPVHGLWQPDEVSIAAWPMLVPGVDVMVQKRKPGEQDGPSYPGTVVASPLGGPWIEVRATWTLWEVTFHGLAFDPGDEIREFFSPLHPFNAFAVYGTDGAFKGWYGNVTRPALLQTSGERPRIIWPDLVLDIVMLPNGVLIELDDDELAASSLPERDPALTAQIFEARDELRRLLRQGFFPTKR